MKKLEIKIKKTDFWSNKYFFEVKILRFQSLGKLYKRSKAKFKVYYSRLIHERERERGHCLPRSLLCFGKPSSRVWKSSKTIDKGRDFLEKRYLESSIGKSNKILPPPPPHKSVFPITRKTNLENIMSNNHSNWGRQKGRMSCIF